MVFARNVNANLPRNLRRSLTFFGRKVDYNWVLKGVYKMLKTPPFVTPFALVSLVLALGATNVVVNKTTHTNEGAKVTNTRVDRRPADDQRRDDSDRNRDSSSDRQTNDQSSSSTVNQQSQSTTNNTNETGNTNRDNSTARSNSTTTNNNSSNTSGANGTGGTTSNQGNTTATNNE